MNKNGSQPRSQTYVVYVEDKPGVLSRVASLFRSNTKLSQAKKKTRSATLSYTLKEFVNRWLQLNEYLTLFPPFKGAKQKLSEEESIEMLYSSIPKRWQGQLLTINFDPDDHTFQEFVEVLERIELADQLNPEESNGDNNGNNNQQKKKKGKRKAKGKRETDEDDEGDKPRKKRKCMLHQVNNHATDDCRVLKAQCDNMRKTWEARSPQERARIKREKKDNKSALQREINAMAAKAAHEAFAMQLKAFKHNLKRVQA